MDTNYNTSPNKRAQFKILHIVAGLSKGQS